MNLSSLIPDCQSVLNLIRINLPVLSSRLQSPPASFFLITICSGSLQIGCSW